MDQIFDGHVMSVGGRDGPGSALRELLRRLHRDARNLVQVQFVEWRGQLEQNDGPRGIRILGNCFGVAQAFPNRDRIPASVRGEWVMKLHIMIEQDEAGYYVAEVPALPGCFSQGHTYEEAIANIKEAIQGWLEVMESKQAVDPSQLIEVAV